MQIVHYRANCLGAPGEANTAFFLSRDYQELVIGVLIKFHHVKFKRRCLAAKNELTLTPSTAKNAVFLAVTY